MSIMVAVSLMQISLLLLATVGLLVAVLITVRLGVWRAASIAGPNRWLDGERGSQLVVIMLLGMVTWLMTQSVYGVLRSQFVSPTVIGQANEPNMKEMLLLNAAAQGLGGLVLVLGNAFRLEGLQTLGLGRRQFIRGIMIGLGSLLLAYPFVIDSALFNEMLWKILEIEHAAKHDLLQLLDRSDETITRFLAIMTAVVIAPVSEELFFRGHLQTVLARTLSVRRRAHVPLPVDSDPATVDSTLLNYQSPEQLSPRALGWRRWSAVIITSFIFAIIHPWWTIIPIFVLSLALGYVYERTGNLWASIAMHMMFNGSSVLFSMLIQP
jgi:membrane protease YdiL (CAAX protease family)